MNETERMKELVKKLNESGKSLLPGRPGDHEQPGVRHAV